MHASGFINARPATRYSSRHMVTAASFAPTAMCLALRFNRSAWKTPPKKRAPDRVPASSTMPYDEQLDKRITFTIADWGTTHKKMFGGTCHLLNGNMLCGVYRHFLILRLGEDSAAQALGRPHIKPFDVTGRPMKGWVMVDSNVLTQADLVKWLNRARDFVSRLPPK
jgi:TfoX/Sxy family transcriptional regulator of competence genes